MSYINVKYQHSTFSVFVCVWLNCHVLGYEIGYLNDKITYVIIGLPFSFSCSLKTTLVIHSIVENLINTDLRKRKSI